jgi:hypothetical protein
MFRKKTKTYHAAAGEIRRYREQTVRLNTHRVSPVILVDTLLDFTTPADLIAWLDQYA